MQTIFLAIENGFEARLILRTNIFRSLKEAGARIIILAPNAEEDGFRSEFEDENVSVESLDLRAYAEFRRRKGQFFALNVRWYTFPHSSVPNTVSMRFDALRRERGVPKTLKERLYNTLFDICVHMLSTSRTLRRWWVRLESALFTPDTHAHLFERYLPDKLVVCSTGFFMNHALLMREARRHGVKVVSVILSWDNTCTKGMSGAFADHVVAWTETMRHELIQYLDYSSEQIFVGGAAIYDHYFRLEALHDRNWLIKHFGLDPARKILYFTLMSPTSFPWNPQLIDCLGRGIEEERFSAPCQVIARLHPIYYRRVDGKLRFAKQLEELMTMRDRYRHIYFDVPETTSEIMSFDMPAAEMVKVGTTLKHIDVLLCFFSSMMIEASIFDKPCISIGIYTKLNTPLDRAMAYTHVARVLATGGIAIAFTEDELIEKINQYLANPSLEREQRLRVIENEAGPNRGFAGQTIGRHVADL